MTIKVCTLEYDYGTVTIFIDKICSISLQKYSDVDGGVLCFTLPYISHTKSFETYQEAKLFYDNTLKEINNV
jgi:hypothetical protein